ncbi:universal stress protein [Parvibaculum sp.]|uniref:universal stress protein n=1 Tax=Parvibaculum sp. TaxID=2024848 RepID=UPI0034A00BD2
MTTLRMARELALHFDAHLDFLHIRSDPAQLLTSGATFPMGAGMVVGGVVDALRQEEEEKAKAARAHFDDFCGLQDISICDTPPGPGRISAAWHEATGAEADLLTAWARTRDALILRPQLPEGGFDLFSTGSILLGCGRPVFLPGPIESTKPARPATGTLAVAWKDTPEAARAVTAAMPFLEKAKKIVVISAVEAGDTTPRHPERLVRQLGWHGLDVEGRTVTPAGRSAPDTVMLEAAATGADFMIMGCYGHSRLREFVFGGFTREVLRGASLPIFTFH